MATGTMTPMLIFLLELRRSKEVFIVGVGAVTEVGTEVEVLAGVVLESRTATGVRGIAGLIKAMMD